MAGMLDSLFSGFTPTQPEDIEGPLLDYLLKAAEEDRKRAQMTHGGQQGGSHGAVIPSPTIATTSQVASPRAISGGDPSIMGGDPLPPLETRTVTERPVAGTAYAPPNPDIVPGDIQRREAAAREPSPAASGPQIKAVEPNAWDFLSRLSRGYNTGGLVGGIADAMNTDRDFGLRNQTAQFIASKVGDPNIAGLIASDPAIMKAVLPSLLTKNPPNLSIVEIFDDKGRPQKAMFNPQNGRIMPVGGVGIGKDTKPPTGYRWKEAGNPEAGVERIPGFEDKIPGEVAGKVAMMNMAAERIKKTRHVFERDWGSGDLAKWSASNIPGVGDIAWLSGDVGIAQRDIQTGIEAALRTMTGAAAPEQEVVRYARMFMPGPQDTKESAKQKIDGLMKFMADAERLVLQGRGQVTLDQAKGMLDQAAGGAPGTAAPGSKPDRDTAIAQARKAIEAGKDPAAVAARLKQWGYSLEGQ